MNAVRPTTEITKAREELAWKLRYRGKSETFIAAEIEKAGLGKISQPGVHKMLARIEGRVYDALLPRILRMRATHTVMLMHQVEELTDAWERSKNADKSVVKQTSGAGSDKEDRTAVKLTDQDGNKDYLAEARRALADIRKMWGADAPTKIAPTTPDGESPYMGNEQVRSELRKLTPQEIEAIVQADEQNRKLLETIDVTPKREAQDCALEETNFENQGSDQGTQTGEGVGTPAP